MTDRAIQIAVARADLMICTLRALRCVAAVILLGAALFFALLAFRQLAEPYHQNYYMPGVDITSEGP